MDSTSSLSIRNSPFLLKRNASWPAATCISGIWLTGSFQASGGPSTARRCHWLGPYSPMPSAYAACGISFVGRTGVLLGVDQCPCSNAEASLVGCSPGADFRSAKSAEMCLSSFNPRLTSTVLTDCLYVDSFRLRKLCEKLSSQAIMHPWRKSATCSLPGDSPAALNTRTGNLLSQPPQLPKKQTSRKTLSKPGSRYSFRTN